MKTRIEGNQVELLHTVGGRSLKFQVASRLFLFNVYALRKRKEPGDT